MAQNKEENTKKSPLAETEEKILAFWKEQNIFQKSLEKESSEGEFIFYEGPPTANGRPGIHHLEARAFKDLIPRYKTMRGFHVSRKAGWDTHGLPVELEVEKKLGFESKKDIESYGVALFNTLCKESVWTYVDEWKDFTNRIGYWIDMEHPYVTYDPHYIESLWSIVKNIEAKNLLYKDYRVVPWCPRDGTALSSHELAQGYQEDTDLSVTVKFKVVGEENTYILAWTTTPWTLPGNVALAIGNDISYVKVEIDGAHIWLAKDRLATVAPDVKILEEAKGKDLVGKKYEPLYPYLSENISGEQKEKLKNAFQVYPADFVTTTDGTGVVHTAVMYGQDDFDLGTKVGLPKFHLVDDTGKFMKFAGPFALRFVKDEDVAVDIIKDLAGRGLLFKKEKFKHQYPHCWRCNTPLIYYARDSWYIAMSKLRSELVSENDKINWEPGYIKDGRFGEWLRDVKDWAISRERYWGTPLPVWVSEDGEEREIVGSIAELKEKIVAKNSYIVMRHGESDKNVRGIVNSDNKTPLPLTKKGHEEVVQAIKELSSSGIDLIITSPLLRTKETALLVAKSLGVDEKSIIEDARLVDLHPGELEGKSIEEYHSFYTNDMDRFTVAPSGGETWTDLCKRIGEFLYELENTYQGKKILIVSHGDPIMIMESLASGFSRESTLAHFKNAPYIQTAEVRALPFTTLPHNENYELDLHRPYIDEFVYVSKSGKTMKRVSEVMDVWFDSGGMPFAQSHYPFENKEWVEKKGYPADYICEAIDQTRGWFYTLHAVGALMGRGKAFNNVICLGHILDKDGQKMSKSKGNTVSPWDMIEKYGVDPLRFWMYTVNQPGESKNFDEKTVDEVVKKVFNLLGNILNFYELYKDSADEKVFRTESDNVLDVWILAMLDELNSTVSKNLDLYRPLEAGRAIREFIAEFSQWYVRRSRDRFKGDDLTDRKNAINTLRFVLSEVAKIVAPFAPFFAEDIYMRVRGVNSKESVHLESWSEVEENRDTVLILDHMNEARRIVGFALEARARAGIKIRQPLSLLSVKSEKLLGKDAYIALIRDEVNIKEVVFGASIEEDVALDTNITPELQAEGDARDLIRAIQEIRKEKNLSPGQSISVSLITTTLGSKTLGMFEQEIKKACFVKDIAVTAEDGDGELWRAIEISA